MGAEEYRELRVGGRGGSEWWARRLVVMGLQEGRKGGWVGVPRVLCDLPGGGGRRSPVIERFYFLCVLG